ncbi:c-type cytochrome [Bryobacter aggregatus]|uniref:c-type cytochrome n=1 Tax=Bryobacter aggregatus TaxID=360054 RepID=UPI0004E0F738|nr:cytochrome c [Bryobacter aggregatus]
MRFALLVLLSPLCAAQAPTWTEIAPLFDRWCNGCHRTGQVGPFDFTTYEGASTYAPEIAREINAAKMPPWGVKPGPLHFSNSRQLPDEVTAKLLAWINANTPNGTAPTLPKRNPQWNLGPPDLIFTQPKEHTVPAEKTVDILSFDIPSAELGTTDKDRDFDAFEFRPSNRELLHHAVLKIGRQPLAAWALCDNGIRLPAGVAWRLPKGQPLTVELHYFKRNLRPARDLTRLALYVPKQQPKRWASLLEIVKTDIKIPAGENLHLEKTSFRIPENLQLHAILPVFQLLADDIRLRIGGQHDYFLWLAPFEHHLMSSYLLAAPLPLKKGTPLEAEALYDNSLQNPFNPHKQLREVHFEENGFDETFRFWLTVSRPR